MKISHIGFKCAIGAVHKPPNYNPKAFIDSLEASLTMRMAVTENLMGIGNVNYNKYGTRYFSYMLYSLECSQLITQVTHILPNSESSIDVLICRNPF